MSKIAIVGIACRLPGADDFTSFANQVDDARAFHGSARELPGFKGSFLDCDLGRFDASYFGILPAEARAIDPQQRFLLELAVEALEDANIKPSTLRGSRAGAFFGVSTHDYADLCQNVLERESLDAYTCTGGSNFSAAGRVSYALGLEGASLVVDTACSSSLVALHLAVQSLRRGETDVALAGGASLILSDKNFRALDALGVLAPDGRSKTFDEAADGYGRGEGVIVMSLKRLDDALRDGNPIHAVILGSACRHNGAGRGFTVPRTFGQEAVIRDALADAAVAWESIDYVEAHGTGTQVGDRIEVRALHNTYGIARAQKSALTIGSIKSAWGHLEAAAGIAGLMRAVAILGKRRWPAQVGLETPSHYCEWDRVHVAPARGSEWPREGGTPRRAAVSSFGISGTNVHVILEEVSVSASAPRSSPLAPPRVLALSAASLPSLEKLVASYRSRLTDENCDVDMLCATAATGRDLRLHRLAVSGDDASALAHALAAPLMPHARSDQPSPRRLAFAFTGQGSSYAGMGLQLRAAYPVFREAWQAMEGVYREVTGHSLDDALTPTALAATRYAQPVLFALQYALTALWRSFGIEADSVFGHSVGEVAAAVHAGVLGAEEAMRFVIRRAELMQEATKSGGMMAVFADAKTCAPFCHDQLVIAAHNAPEVTILSGDKVALAIATKQLALQGIAYKELPVSGAFHAPLVDKVLPEVFSAAQALAWQAPRRRFLSTMLGGAFGDAVDWPAYFRDQMRRPVLFAATVAHVASSDYLEIGPGAALSALGPRCGPGRWHASLAGSSRELQSLASALASLHEAGFDLDWAAVFAPWAHRRGRAPVYPFTGDRHWIEEKTNGSERMNQRAASDVKVRLESIFKNVTGLAMRPEDEDQSFLRLGTDSMMIVKLAQGIQREFGVEIALGRFYDELTTFQRVAAFVASQARIPEPARTEPAAAEALELAQVSSAGGSELERVIAQQLVLMQAQLASLRAQTAASETTPGSSRQTAAKARTQLRPYQFIKTTEERELTARQRTWLHDFTQRYNERTAGSKAYAAKHRDHHADWIASIAFRPHLKELCYPIVSSRAEGAWLWDVDGRRYVDVGMGFGVALFGANPPFVLDALRRQVERGFELATQSELAGEVAELVCSLTGVERVTFANTGTEAVMTAMRLARAHTGRSKIAMFRHAFHGSFDGILAEHDDQGQSFPRCPGTTPGMVSDIIILDYGSDEALELLQRHRHELAAVLVEPVQSRRPQLQPKAFLHELRRLTAEAGALLIFDEMVTGFRIAAGGAQSFFDVRADLVCYGKIAGGGLPIGIIAGRAQVMDGIDGGPWQFGNDSVPAAATTIFGGTFCRHPLALAASRATLLEIQKRGPMLYENLNARSAHFIADCNETFASFGVPIEAVAFGSQFKFEFSGTFAQVLRPVEMDLFYNVLMHHGVYTWERRIAFLSDAHQSDALKHTIDAIGRSLAAMKEGGFFEGCNGNGGGGGGSMPRTLPQTSAQRGIFAAAQSPAGERAYHLTSAWELEGPIDLTRLQEALDTVVARHDALRMALVVEDGALLQREELSCKLALECCESDEAGLAAALEYSRRPFDFGRPPLLRVSYIALPRSKAILVIDAHHAVMDGVSLDIFLQELAAAYDGAPLPALPFDWKGFVSWDEERQRAQSISDQGPPLMLPLDRAAGPQRGFTGQILTTCLEGERKKAVETLARECDASVYGVLLALYGALLSRLTGHEKITVPTVSSGRPEARLEGLCGMFAETVAVAVDLEASAPFDELARTTTRHALALLAATEPQALSEAPSTMFSYERTRSRHLTLGGIGSEQLWLPEVGAKFDFALDVVHDDQALILNFSFDDTCLDEGTARSWALAFERALDAVIQEPSQACASLPFLDETILNAWSKGVVRPISGAATSVVDLIARQVRATPDAIALRAGDNTISYAQLDALSHRVAASLSKHYNVVRGDLLALAVERSVEAVIAILASLKIGATYVPIDPSYPEQRRRDMMNDAQCKLVVTLDLVRQLISQGREFQKEPLTGPKGDDIAYMIYTSGSTGKPKGVPISHRSLVHYIDYAARAYFATPETRHAGNFALYSSLAFDLTVTSIFCPLVRGKCLHIYPHDQAIDETLAEMLQPESGVDALKITPSHLALIAHLEVSTSKLAVAIVGGEALLPAHVEALHALNPAMRIFNEYGPTEATVGCVVHEVRSAQERIVIGRPIDRMHMHVRDGQGRPTLVGVPGELWIGGEGVAGGYWRRPDLTPQKFQSDSDHPGSLLYRSGDLVRWTSRGELDYLGRLDAQVKIRGHRIELGEIESTLRRLGGVLDAAVVVREEASDRELWAYVVMADDQDSAPLRQALAEVLPDYMLPAHIVALPALPLTAHGKLDTTALPKKAPPAKPQQAAATGVSAEVLAVYREILAAPMLGASDDFLVHGGDSIKAIRIASRLTRLGFACNSRDVLVAGSADNLARRLQTATDGVDGDLAAEADDKVDELTEWQFGPAHAWWAELASDLTARFAQSVIMESREQLDEARLIEALNALVARHAALRLTINAVDLARGLARIGPPKPASLTIASEEESDAALEAMHARLDISKGRCFAAVLLRHPEGNTLVVAAHHACVDAISWEVLRDELELLYEGASLPPPTASFGAWREALVARANSERGQKELDYWRTCEQSGEARPLPEGAPTSSQGRLVERWSVDAALTTKLGPKLETLLAGVAWALRQLSSKQSFVISLESHGRQAEDTPDVGRSLGWFTAIHPFPLTTGQDVRTTAAMIAEELARRPQQGAGYGPLRYFTAEGRAQLGQIVPQIIFNDLGDFGDDRRSATRLFSLQAETSAQAVDDDLQYPYALEIETWIAAGKRHVSLCFDARRVAGATISQLRQGLIDAWSQLANDAPRFSMRGLTDGDLDELFN